ncbi:cytochrome c biogenesis protein CcmG, thiol:disulfide interchange protein DsbE [Marinobacter daqiaonensis]|uniref:Cytochrome c biogenesis protein CcmG, thiol:disulfide interchange protein DsbE n=1 Tax=Marinobacter daqiaonensis TaxID=650891 RepID=A0A1I6H5L3_9GAMM|nr:DsbE family thiol:disulfide interchange protein [Marinobacter daqiaonensis]SFR49728.1 cytochrome c biogenesis protein CcmG, thiol:disulfide interchange protein DsbE [Marinobacter daqiaonensis]
MRRFLLFIPVILAIAVGVFLASGLGKDPQELDSALIGKPVPVFELSDLKNPDRALTPEVFQGQVSLLNVWATWCPACRDEHDDLIWLAEEKGIPIIGLNYKDNRDQALEWLQDLGDPYQLTLFDPRGRLGFDLGVYGAPETYIIDQQGIVRFRHVGVVDEKVWEEELQPRIRQYREEG